MNRNTFATAIILIFLAAPGNAVGLSQPTPLEIKTLKTKATSGDADAEAKLGLYYSDGFGVEQNYGESFKWHKMAADRGNAEAQKGLGDLYFYGRVDGSHNYTEAAFWYTLAALGNPDNTHAALRDIALDQLTPDEIAAVKKRVQAWKSTTHSEHGPIPSR